MRMHVCVLLLTYRGVLKTCRRLPLALLLGVRGSISAEDGVGGGTGAVAAVFSSSCLCVCACACCP